MQVWAVLSFTNDSVRFWQGWSGQRLGLCLPEALRSVPLLSSLSWFPLPPSVNSPASFIIIPVYLPRWYTGYKKKKMDWDSWRSLLLSLQKALQSFCWSCLYHSAEEVEEVDSTLMMTWSFHTSTWCCLYIHITLFIGLYGWGLDSSFQGFVELILWSTIWI